MDTLLPNLGFQGSEGGPYVSFVLPTVLSADLSPVALAKGEALCEGGSSLSSLIWAFQTSDGGPNYLNHASNGHPLP